MRKIIIIISLLFLICGCSNKENVIDYKLNINKSFAEDINFYLEKNAKKIANEDEKSDNTSISLEYTMLKNAQYPIFGNNDIVYNKIINNNIIRLNYNYTEDEYLNNNYIMSCFENYKIDSNDTIFSINLSGKFKCFENNNITNLNIIVKSNYPILETNGINSKEGYKWIINRNNYQNTNIILKISRNYDMMLIENTNDKNKNVIKGIIKIIFLVLVFYLIIKIYKKYKKNKL